jgi:hypothetical protein
VATAAITSPVTEPWHARFGHRGDSINKLLTAVYDLPANKPTSINTIHAPCEHCVNGHGRRTKIATTHKESTTLQPATRVGERLHCDLTAPMTAYNPLSNRRDRVATAGGAIYGLIIVDEYSRYSWVYLLKYKTQAAACVNQVCEWFVNRLGVPVAEVHSDGGTEFINAKIRVPLVTSGGTLTYTTTDTPRHNGIAERCIGVLFEILRSWKSHSGFPNLLWGEALLHANYVRNRTPRSGTPARVPWQSLFSTDLLPSVDKLRIFGSDCQVMVPAPDRTSLDLRSELAIYIGVSEAQNAYRVLLPDTYTVRVSRDVKFDESSFDLIKLYRCEADDDNYDPTNHSELQFSDPSTTGTDTEINQSSHLPNDERPSVVPIGMRDSDDFGLDLSAADEHEMNAREPAARQLTTGCREPAARQLTTDAWEQAARQRTTSSREPAARQLTTGCREPAARQLTTDAWEQAARQRTTSSREPAARQLTTDAWEQAARQRTTSSREPAARQLTTGSREQAARQLTTANREQAARQRTTGNVQTAHSHSRRIVEPSTGTTYSDSDSRKGKRDNATVTHSTTSRIAFPTDPNAEIYLPQIAPTVVTRAGRESKPVAEYGRPNEYDYLYYTAGVSLSHVGVSPTVKRTVTAGVSPSQVGVSLTVAQHIAQAVTAGTKHTAHAVSAGSTVTPTQVTVTKYNEEPLPKSYTQAMKCGNAPEWCKAMKEEIEAQHCMDVWTLVVPPHGSNVIDARWVYNYKRDSLGDIVRYKARFVCKGFQQLEGIDYNETYAPVVIGKSLRLVLAIAAALDLELKQLDFDTAFLYASVPETIYMHQPEGYHDGTNKVCRLNKALYGLKQAPHEWNNKINGTLLGFGYTRCKIDPCVYIKNGTVNGVTVMLMLCLYVDDTIIAYNTAGESLWLADKHAIMLEYKIKDLGNCEWLLNLKVTRNRSARTLTLCQESYIDKLLAKFNMTDTKVVPSPALCHQSVTPLDQTQAIELTIDGKEHRLYRALIGSLMYAAQITRVDIAFAVSNLSRHLHQPYQHHMNAARRVLKYLGCTKWYSLIFTVAKEGAVPLKVYTDADWATDLNERRSTTGTLVQYNGNTIAWNSSLQKSTAGSTAEAEYVALNDAVIEAGWFRSWLREVLGSSNNDVPVISSVTVGNNDSSIPNIMVDNKAAIQIATKGLASAPKTKHIAIKYHIVQQEVQANTVALHWCETKLQLADILTKALGPQQHQAVVPQLLYTVNQSK